MQTRGGPENPKAKRQQANRQDLRCFLHLWTESTLVAQLSMKLDDSVARKKAGGRRREDKKHEHLIIDDDDDVDDDEW